MSFGTRSYARPYGSRGGLPRGVQGLLIANTALFLILFFGRQSVNSIVSLLALTPADVVRSFEIWQLATYLFLHFGVLGFLFNMLALWMFGKELEETWGTERFLRFYFLCGAGAGVSTEAGTAGGGVSAVRHGVRPSTTRDERHQPRRRRCDARHRPRPSRAE